MLYNNIIFRSLIQSDPKGRTASANPLDEDANVFLDFFSRCAEGFDDLPVCAIRHLNTHDFLLFIPPVGGLFGPMIMHFVFFVKYRHGLRIRNFPVPSDRKIFPSNPTRKGRSTGK